MQGMVIDMDETKLQTVAQVRTFLEGTHDLALKNLFEVKVTALLELAEITNFTL